MTEAVAVGPARTSRVSDKLNGLRAFLSVPVDVASLAVFRCLFGALLALSALRFLSSGWVERFFAERTFFFKYWGFGWIEPLSARGMSLLYATICLFALCVALGLLYRLAIALLFAAFSYAELTDVTNYLNHYYLVSLLCFLMCFMPLSGAFSFDAWRRPEARCETVPRFMLWLLRFQICIVYFYASKAKWGSDWLLEGQPLRSWLLPQVDLPWIGPLLLRPGVALFVSWAGMLHDLLVPPLLLWKRTRPYAYAALLIFHLTTSQWFNIGIFPFLMPIAATLFFDADWPRKALGRLWPLGAARRRTSTSTTTMVSGTMLVAALVYASVQVLVPLRSHLYGGNVLWHEQGMRFSWRVMVRAKHGSIHYRVRLADGRELRVSPRRYLTTDQEREMSGQPDLILQLAHHVARQFEAAGRGPVQVRVDALVALNGRPARPMIDPEVDLAQVEDGLVKAWWITPGPP